MKISVDGVEVFELTPIQKKVIQHDIPKEIFEEDMKRRLEWVLTHKYERCFKRLKEKWMPKLIESGIKTLPIDDAQLANLIFALPEYKDRSAREKEEVDA